MKEDFLMTDSEKLDLILSGMNEMKTDVQSLKADVQNLASTKQKRGTCTS